MALQFKKAEKTKSKLRLALIGPSGSGKTYTALTLAQGLAEGNPVAVIDTERGSASLYADLFAFDVLELEEFDPRRYVEAIAAAEAAGYGVIVIDSLTHAWSGKGGALELVDRAAKRQQSGNSFGAWREVTPLHNQLVDTLLGAQAHIIATIRTKTDYVQERDERTNKTVVRKVGLAPVQRDGLEYEFTLVGDMDIDHNLLISKTRIPALADQVINKPSGDLARHLLAWLNTGAEPAQPPPAAQTNGTAPDPTKPVEHMTQAGALRELTRREESALPTADPDLPRKAFWGTAVNLGYVTPEGQVSKRLVHEALGLEARDGALKEWMEADGLSWETVAAQLSRIGPHKRQPTLVDLPAERTAAHAAKGAH